MFIIHRDSISFLYFVCTYTIRSNKRNGGECMSTDPAVISSESSEPIVRIIADDPNHPQYIAAMNSPHKKRVTDPVTLKRSICYTPAVSPAEIASS